MRYQSEYVFRSFNFVCITVLRTHVGPRLFLCPTFPHIPYKPYYLYKHHYQGVNVIVSLKYFKIEQVPNSNIFNVEILNYSADIFPKYVF